MSWSVSGKRRKRSSVRIERNSHRGTEAQRIERTLRAEGSRRCYLRADEIAAAWPFDLVAAREVDHREEPELTETTALHRRDLGLGALKSLCVRR